MSAESDLASYRSRYGLPACTEENGCFEKVNEQGERGNYPPEEQSPQGSGWKVETALDVDMASATCPECHILLVEASGEKPANLGESVNTAVRLGAPVISSSWLLPELNKELCGLTGCSQFSADFDHPGVMILSASGDTGFENHDFVVEHAGTNWPAALPDVVAVGGTALFKDASSPRGWRERVWNEPETPPLRLVPVGTGSGCTKFEPKPAWQTEKGCAKRIDNDVAADAALETAVSIRFNGAWELEGGTSAATPIVAGIEAHASQVVRALGPEAFYEDPSSLFDVTEGFNWNPTHGSSECAANEFLCNAEVGYDGPTGLGTPDGVPAASALAPAVTKISPKSGTAGGGTTVTITGINFTDAEEVGVKFGAVQASGLKVGSATSITVASPPGAVGTADVTVTTAAGTSPVNTTDEFKYTKPKK